MGLFSGISDFLGPAAMAGGYMLGGPAGGALMAGGLGYMGMQQTNEQNYDLAQSNSAFNAQQAQMNRDFQQQMSSTAYQRATQDMEAAGLNPMLAYMQGGASTPSGSVASAQQATMQNPATAGIEAYSGVSSAGQSQSMVAQIESTTDKVKAEINKIKGDTNFADQQDILRQTAWSLSQAGALSQERGITEGQQRAVMAATIDNLKKDGTLKQLDIDAAKKFENWGREFKQLQPVIELLVKLLK